VLDRIELPESYVIRKKDRSQRRNSSPGFDRHGGCTGTLGAGFSTRREIVADHVAVAETEIEAPPDQVWSALTDPQQIEKYMFGSQVETDWNPGSRITWKGEYEGKTYEDRGEILEVEPGRRLKVTHFSPLSGDEDVPENYHTILYELEEAGTRTRVRLQPGQQSHGRAGRAFEGQLGEDVVRAQRGRRERLGRPARRLRPDIPFCLDVEVPL
jgi:uncharacterized protein YndB with AHSA1/START domain